MVGMRYIKLPLFCVVLGFVFGLILSALHSQWKAFEDPSLYMAEWCSVQIALVTTNTENVLKSKVLETSK